MADEQAIDTVSVAPINKSVSVSVIQECNALLNSAMGILIETDDDYAGYGQILVRIKAQRKKVDETYKQASRPIAEALEAIRGWFRPTTETLNKADDIISSAMNGYNRAKEEKAKIEQERLNKQAEEEAKKLREEAAEALKQGDQAKAEELVMASEVTKAIVPEVQGEKVKTKGLAERDNWTGIVNDEKALIAHCVATGDKYIIVDQKFVNAMAKTTKGKLNIPGIVWHKETKIGGSR
jgi:hypothetical protein